MSLAHPAALAAAVVVLHAASTAHAGDPTRGDAALALGGAIAIVESSVLGGSAWVAGDLDGDGRVDLVSAGLTGIAARLNRGGGTFDAVSSPVPLLAETLGLADVDGDGTLDAVVAEGDLGNGVAVLRGLGDGRFEAWWLAEPPLLARGATTADLDGDGDPDLVVPVYDGPVDVRLAINDAGTLGRLVDLDLVDEAVGRIVVLDVEGDGTDELLLLGLCGGFTIVRDAAGSPALEPIAFGLPCGIARVRPADTDGDGDADLLIQAGIFGSPSVHLRREPGAWVAAGLVTPGPYGDVFQGLPLAADVDGDGADEFIGLTENTGRRVVVQVDGGSPRATEFIGDTTLDLTVAFAADLTGDGRAELMLPVRTFLEDGPVIDLEAFLRTDDGYIDRTVLLPPLPVGSRVSTVDLDGDGRLDVVSARRLAGDIRVLRSTQSGDLLPAAQLTVAEVIYPDVRVVDASTPPDGILDVVSLGVRFAPPPRDARIVRVHEGLGGFEFGPEQVGLASEGLGSIGDPGDGWDAADIDGDGDADVVRTISLFEQQLEAWRRIPGGWESPVLLTPSVTSSWLRLRDLNGDGAPDLVSAWSGGQGTVLSIRLGTGELDFLADGPEVLVPADGVQTLRIALVETEGAVVAITFAAGPELWVVPVLRGPKPGFGTPRSIATMPRSPETLAVLDLDGDGRPDVATGWSVPVGEADRARGVRLWLDILADGPAGPQGPLATARVRNVQSLADGGVVTGGPSLLVSTAESGRLVRQQLASIAGFGAADAACPPDLDGDGAVGLLDLLAVLAAFGPCEACPADVDGSGAVDFGDLLVLLGAWGPCPA